MNAEPITVTEHHQDGRRFLTVEHWPRESAIDIEILRMVEPAFMRREGDALIIEVENGRAEYEIGELNVVTLSYPLYLVSSRLTELAARPQPEGAEEGHDATE